MLVDNRLVISLIRALVFGLGSLSILSLLLYFHGIISFSEGVRWLLLAEVIGLVALALWAWAKGRDDTLRWLAGGLWAGGLATLAYDVVRVPIAVSGIPVFKAISYFGTVLLGYDKPNIWSEAAGWLYHLSNGLSFALMYLALIKRPGAVTAMMWGVALEAAMLLTPYAEVFGYQRDARFIAISLGAHAVYGIVLWLALRQWMTPGKKLAAPSLWLGWLVAPVGIALVAANFYSRYADKLPPSPPPYLGPHLYITWDVPEPDRLAALWVLKRFADPSARFHFVPPFTMLTYGRPFDLPEAEIRRQSVTSATEVLLERNRLDTDPRLRSLAAMTHLAEVTPWMLPSDEDADRLAQKIRSVAAGACGNALTGACLEAVFAFIDDWYKNPSR